ncbi:cytochrome c oxidase subunit II [Pseudopedobacter saltans DSM 12145]|uniref:Cytochrome c oxidase subunit 2 n=1 Tax=Pseudopedobacter saltans (strain ATCC 51119 / DSM 12145 / JCM 21818 / CCUG 39354 / LMG 10337 / NBRC 100064 / NCIMB 13643) TaxID=762903 RepID=F0S5K0_PSESL|nr:cytochrome c oxidase subunit II [Pseudopedobacter saltans]ADY53164.1 cytochrome c oxidase subunit II [Pseudopedobacter saltans DSM 12145]
MNIKKYLNLRAALSLFGLMSLSLTSVMAQTAEQAVDAAAKHEGLGKVVSYYVLIFLLIALFIGVIGKVLRVYELTKNIQGKKEGIAWNKFNGILFIVALLTGLYGTYWSYAVHGAQILPAAASEHGKSVDSMFNTTLIITTIVFVLTHIALFFFVFKYKFSKKKKAYFYPHNDTLEKYWTIIPAIALSILVLMGFFIWRGITNVSEGDIAKAIKIDITAQQFKWNVRYAGADNENGKKNYKLIGSLNGLNAMGLDLSDKRNYDDLHVNEIVLPVNRPVRFTLTSMDVLHSFYMPHFRVQMNCVPGMPTFFQFTPTITTAEMQEKTNDPKFEYILLCAKICGGSHYNMKFNVKVVSEKEYQKWLVEQKPIVTEDMKKEYQLALEKENGISKQIALNN